MVTSSTTNTDSFKVTTPSEQEICIRLFDAPRQLVFEAMTTPEHVKRWWGRLGEGYTNTAHRFIAEDDYVVVECRGHATTKSGKAYNNTYCYVIRFEGGKARELTEYLDTALVEAALDAPRR